MRPPPHGPGPIGAASSLRAPEIGVARRLNGEIVVVLGWARAILLQLAHPLVAAGVADHSDFRQGALGYAARSHRTIGAMLSLTYSAEAEVRETAGRINAIHDRVHGRLRRAAGRFPAGTPYSARDPELLRWVHATLLETIPLSYELLVGTLTQAERDQYCEESAPVGALLGIPDDLLPRREAALRDYMAAAYASGTIHVTETARELAAGLLASPIGPLGAPLFGMARTVTIGMLPPHVRKGYGFTWSAEDRKRFRRWLFLLRTIRLLLPRRLHEWPAARRITTRC